MGRWFDSIIPDFLREKSDGTSEMQKAVVNVNWLFLGNVTRRLIGFATGIWVIRYLGPDRFGTLSYCIALVSMLSFLSVLGLSRIVVRELVDRPRRTPMILGSAALLKIGGSIAQALIALLLILVLKPKQWELMLFVAILSFGHLLRPLEVIDYWFQAKVQSKYVVLSDIAGTTVVSVLRIVFILLAAPLVAFVISASLFTALSFVFLLIPFHRHGDCPVRTWTVEKSTLSNLLRDGWPLMLSSLAVHVYMQVDQVMIGAMLDDISLGHYSSAVKISEIWYFLAQAIVASVLPALLRMRNKDRRKYIAGLQTIYTVFVWFTCTVAFGIAFFSEMLIGLFFGQEFIAGASVLTVHIWSGVFVFLGSASSLFLIGENLTRISLACTLSGMVVNIVLNTILIPRVGIVGAAWATLISYAVSGWLTHLVFSRSRILFFMPLRATNPLGLIKFLSRRRG